MAKPWFVRARLRARHLLLLTAIGEEGNIHKAAEMMNMSQPAASRLLRDLEQIIGAELFERLPRGVRPNWYGLTMIRHARNALSSLSRAAGEIDLLKTGRAGEVRVGAIRGPAIRLVPKAVARITRDHPMIKIQLQIDSSDRLIDTLLQGNIEIMIGRLLDQHDKSLFDFENLADEPVSAIVRRGHPLLLNPSIGYGEMAEAAWILPPIGTILRHKFDLMFKQEGHPLPKQIIETVSSIFMTRVLEETDFVAVTSTDVAQYYSKCGLVAELPIRLACSMDAFGIITRNDSLLSPAAELMLGAIRETAGAIYTRPASRRPSEA